MRAQNTLSSAIRRQCVARWHAMACVWCALSRVLPTHRCWTRRAHSKAQTWLKLVSLICLLRLATNRRWKITLVSDLSKEKHKNFRFCSHFFLSYVRSLSKCWWCCRSYYDGVAVFERRCSSFAHRCESIFSLGVVVDIAARMDRQTVESHWCIDKTQTWTFVENKINNEIENKKKKFQMLNQTISKVCLIIIIFFFFFSFFLLIIILYSRLFFLFKTKKRFLFCKILILQIPLEPTFKLFYSFPIIVFN